MSKPTLYHFTCDHGYGGICHLGYVGPNWHPLIGSQLAWFTDDPSPDRVDVGLLVGIESSLSCDRMRYRFRVTDPSLCRRWVGSPERGGMTADGLLALESCGVPGSWWISTARVLARPDALVPAEVQR